METLRREFADSWQRAYTADGVNPLWVDYLLAVFGKETIARQTVDSSEAFLVGASGDLIRGSAIVEFDWAGPEAHQRLASLLELRLAHGLFPSDRRDSAVRRDRSAKALPGQDFQATAQQAYARDQPPEGSQC